jgi:hypothetical protein
MLVVEKASAAKKAARMIKRGKLVINKVVVLLITRARGQIHDGDFSPKESRTSGIHKTNARGN